MLFAIVFEQRLERRACNHGRNCPPSKPTSGHSKLWKIYGSKSYHFSITLVLKNAIFGPSQSRALPGLRNITEWSFHSSACVANVLAIQQRLERRALEQHNATVALQQRLHRNNCAMLPAAAPCVATAVGSQQAFCWHFIGFTNMSEIDGAVAAASSLVNKKKSLVLINFHGCFWKCSWSLMILCFFWRIKLRKVAPPCPTPYWMMQKTL